LSVNADRRAPRGRGSHQAHAAGSGSHPDRRPSWCAHQAHAGGIGSHPDRRAPLVVRDDRAGARAQRGTLRGARPRGIERDARRRGEQHARARREQDDHACAARISRRVFY